MRIPKFSGLRSRREKGSLTIEMALAMPVLLFLIAGVLDLGMLFYEKQVITNASREGARAAVKAVDTGTSVVADLTQTEVKQKVQNYLNQYAIKDLDDSPLVLSSGTFDYFWADTPSGKVLTVELKQIPCKMMLIPNVKTLFGGTRSSGDDVYYLSAQTSMAAEWTTPPSP
jgi:hypothetical protein